nr:chemokine-like factor [Anolis sagrei ordinatus]
MVEVNQAFLRSVRGGLKMARMCCIFQDAFNSLVAALFLFIAGLCGIIKKVIPEDLIGGVFFLILCALCIADAVFLLKNINFNRPPTSRDIIHR